MTQPESLPSLNPIPDDIEDHLKRLLHRPNGAELGEWLLELIKSSGHMSTTDDLRWRLFCMVWLAYEFDADAAWPYLMWFNVNERAISTHLSEILIEAIDNFDAYIQTANWLAKTTDDRLDNFFQDFYVIPATRKMKPFISKLFADDPAGPEIGVWLATFCQGAAYNEAASMRPWRLLTAAWYAACFNPKEGLKYLQNLTNGAAALSSDDNQRLMEAAGDTNALTPMIQFIADCPDPTIKELLKDFSHPNLPAMAETMLQSPPDYSHLADSTEQAQLDAETFKRNLAYLEQANLSPKTTSLLDVACGPLIPHTLLFNSVGYKTLGLDLHIPPGYLPLSGIRQWFKRNQHAKAWKTATASYYQTLADHTGKKLKWNKVEVKQADLTRLDIADNTFDVVICANYLQHTPDVNGLLAETARVLKPGGLFLTDIVPYASLNGSFQFDLESPWGHLRQKELSSSASSISLNKWREARYRASLEKYFTLERWLPEIDEQAQAQLTPAIQAELADYDEAELTRKQIIVVAKKQL